MKRQIAALLAALLMIALCGCGGSPAEADTPAETDTQPAAASGTDAVVTKPASASDAEQTETPTGETDTQPDPTVLDEALYATAQTFVDNSVDELILAIGQPILKEETPESTASVPKYKLTYPGFYVYTTRVSAGEMLDAVELMP